MTSTHKQLQIKITGETHNDIMVALDQVLNEVEDKHMSGGYTNFGRNDTKIYETRSYWFEMKELTVTEPTKSVPQEQSITRMNRETTITKEQLEEVK